VASRTRTIVTGILVGYLLIRTCLLFFITDTESIKKAYVLNLELIKLSIQSEVGGDNSTLKLNLQQLSVGNILDNHICIFVFNFSKLQGNRFRYQKSKTMSSLTITVTLAFRVSRVSD